MTVSGIPTPERRVYADFLPYFWTRNQLVSLADTPVPESPAAFTANPALRLGVVRSYRHGPGWDEWIDHLRKLGRVEEVADAQGLVNLLRGRRITAFPGLPAVTGALVERYDLREKVVLRHWFRDRPKIESGLVLSRQRLPAPTVASIRLALEALRNDGSLLAIYKRHFPEAQALDLLSPGPERAALRFSISSAWSMPFSQPDHQGSTGNGIVFELATAIAQSLQRRPAFVILPRNRIDEAVHSGAIDVRCYTSPAWVKAPERYLWSSLLLEIPDVVFGHADSPPPASVERIPDGSTIGTVLGYTYPALEPAFSSRRLVRQDANDQERVFLKVANRRNDYAVSNSFTLDWLLRTHGREHIAPWRIKLTTHEFRCGVVKSPPAEAENILAAIEHLKSSGQIQRIADAYR
jgi:polar amino acid transport system substrate-binding protein